MIMDNSRRNFLKTGLTMASGALLASEGYAEKIFSSAHSDNSSIKTLSHPVCVFTKCLQYLDYDQLALTIAKAGYDGADLSVRAGGHVLPESVRKDLPRAVKALEKAGVSTPMMVTTIVDADDKYTEPVLGTAADLGIKYYRMGYLDYDKSKTIPQNIDTHRKAFEKLEKINRKYGIHGSYQNHSGNRVGGSVWDLYLIIKDLDPKYIGIQYDIRHAIFEGAQSWTVGMDLVAPWISSCPIKDFFWKKERNRWMANDVPLGEGMVNFDTFLKKYKELKLSGPFSLHLEYDLGGADKGSRTPTMPHEEIAGYLKADIDWFRNKLMIHNIS